MPTQVKESLGWPFLVLSPLKDLPFTYCKNEFVLMIRDGHGLVLFKVWRKTVDFPVITTTFWVQPRQYCRFLVSLSLPRVGSLDHGMGTGSAIHQ